MKTRLLFGAIVPAIFLACGSDDSGATGGGGDDGGVGQDGTVADGAGGDGSAGDGSQGDGGGGDGSQGDGGNPMPGASVVQRNNNPTRDGHFVQPTLTKTAAATMKMDTSLAATFTGNVYASPLYVENGPGGKGAFIIATENNDLMALDETSGAKLWSVNLGTAATQTGAGCGNIAPIGITGTPYIDLSTRTIYVNAAIANAGNIGTHQIHARSLDDGSAKTGWPVDTSTIHAVNGGVAFNPTLQNQRSSLIVVNGDLYVVYGGHAGDCGDYHGWVMVVPTTNPAGTKGYRTPARGCGMWAPGGPSSDGTGIFVSTGNSFGANTFQGGEAVLRVASGAAFSGNATDYFIPSNWLALDNGDVDIGGSGPVVVDVPGANPSALVVALGKSGVMHVLNRANLGGQANGNGTTGEGVVSAQVMGGEIINAAATYKTAMGTYVVMHGHQGAQGVGCPNGTAGDLVAVKIGAASPPTLTVAWCANNLGQGSPIVTTTDGMSNAVVWTAGSESSRKLHGFDGDTGAVIFAGGATTDQMTGLRRFTSPIAVKGRIIVAGDGHVYAFKPM
jgi:hypothetical protein